MSGLTSKERIARILKRQPVDRAGLHEHWWPETTAKWQKEGYLAENESADDHFGLDIRTFFHPNLVADPDFEMQIVEETDETKLVRDGNGALLRWWKDKSGTPEHVDFLVKDRASWEEHIRGHLKNECHYRKRLDLDTYREIKQKCSAKDLFFFWSSANVFEYMHPVCGHENMLMGMALDPDWIKDMCEVYADLIINLMEILFAEKGRPDGIWFYEDMGFKNKPFMSPAMYKELVWPAHKKTFDYAHSLDLPVVVHSCGFVEPLVPELIKAGMDCLQAMEVKAGMDLVKLKNTFGNQIAFMGGLDVRPMVANDREAIQAELDSKLPVAMKDSGYIIHSDHSIPDQVEYDTYKFFVERSLEIGTYA